MESLKGLIGGKIIIVQFRRTGQLENISACWYYLNQLLLLISMLGWLTIKIYYFTYTSFCYFSCQGCRFIPRFELHFP